MRLNEKAHPDSCLPPGWKIDSFETEREEFFLRPQNSRGERSAGYFDPTNAAFIFRGLIPKNLSSSSPGVTRQILLCSISPRGSGGTCLSHVSNLQQIWTIQNSQEARLGERNVRLLTPDISSSPSNLFGMGEDHGNQTWAWFQQICVRFERCVLHEAASGIVEKQSEKRFYWMNLSRKSTKTTSLLVPISSRKRRRQWKSNMRMVTGVPPKRRTLCATVTPDLVSVGGHTSSGQVHCTNAF